MPIYEFICQKCNARSSVLVRSIGQSVEVECPGCGSSDLKRALSTFAYHKSIQTIHEEAGTPGINAGPDYYKDPRNVGRWAEEKFAGSGMEMPDQLKEEIQSIREGELPKDLKQQMDS